VDGAGTGQLVRASYPPLGGRVQSGHWHFDLVLLVTTSKIVFEPRLGPARSTKRLPLVGGRKTRPLIVWVVLIRKRRLPV
jgi:hypothetical protein